MRELWRSLIDDRTFFVRVLRGALFAFAAYKLGGTDQILAILAGAGGGFLGAGEKNK